MRLGSRDLRTGRPAVVADSWDINERKCTRRGMRTGYATRGGFGGFASKPSAAGFPGLRLKTGGGGPDADGRHVAASGRLLGSKATGEEARWPSDQKKTIVGPICP